MPIESQQTLEPPRFETGRSLLLAGLSEHYQAETVAGIPTLWQRFGPHIGRVPHRGHIATIRATCNAI